MPVKTQAEILNDLAKSAEAMVRVQKIAEETSAALRDAEPTPIQGLPGSLIEPERFDR